MAPPGSSRPSLTYTDQALEASLPAITPYLKFGALDFLSAKLTILSVSRCRKELRHKATFTRHGSHPRYSPGHLPGLPICRGTSGPRCPRAVIRSKNPSAALGCHQIPAQAFHVQSVDLLKGLLRDSDVFLALRMDALREHDNVGFPCRHYPNCSAASPSIRGTSLK